ncbi:MAG TPA: heme exporter protein CcmB [Spirochaetota bacterium]
MGDILQLIKKDLKVESRARYAVTVALSFALSIVFMLTIALGGVAPTVRMNAALIWITIFFASSQIVPHLFVRECEEETELLIHLRFMPRHIFMSKLICMMILLLPVTSLTVVLYLFFLSVRPHNLLLFVALAFTGTCALACAGALSASIASRARGKGALSALLSVPAVLPLLVVLVSGTAQAIAESRVNYSDVVFVVSYGAIIAAVSVILFEYIWKD